MIEDDFSGIPNSPSELLKLQSTMSEKVSKVVHLIDELEISPAEMLDLGLRICGFLEQLHEDCIQDHVDFSESDRESLVAWAKDAERLSQCVELLRAIRL